MADSGFSHWGMFRREMTDRRVHRRRLLQLLGVRTAAALAGCDYPRHRDMTFSGVNVTEGSEDEYITEVTPMKSNSDGTDQWQTFHNVMVIGYAESGDRGGVESWGPRVSGLPGIDT